MPVLPDLPVTESAIVELTNAFRRGSKLASVASEGTLTKAARDYAGYLAAATVFSHEADGRRPADRIKAAGYAACNSAENLAWMLDSRGFETHELASRMVEGWKGSPPHRQNMLIEHVTDTGVAVAKVAGAEKYVAVQLFGRPQSLQYQFEMVNASGRTVSFTVAGKRGEVAADHRVRYTLCTPADLAIDIKDSGLAAKAEPLRFKTAGGQVYRLTRAAGGAVKVEVETAAR